MESQKTTNILLIILIIGISFLTLLFITERRVPESIYEPIVQEEPVYTPPTTSPINPTPNPTPSPNPTLTTQQNINLVEGQSYFYEFSNDTSITKAKYCGIQSKTIFGDVLFRGMIFVPIGAENCNSDQVGAAGYKTNSITVKLKSTTLKSQLDALNVTYNLSERDNPYSNNPPGTYTLSLNSNNINAYTMAKIYFDSGLFAYTSLTQVFSINNAN